MSVESAQNGKSASMVKDLTRGNVARTMIFFAAPLLFSSILQTAYNLTDMMVVGRFIGRDGLAAVSIGGDVLHFICFISIGFSHAGQVIIAQLIGAGDRDGVRRLIGTIFTFLMGCGLVTSIGGLILLPRILEWINTPPEVYDYTRSYLTVAFSCLCFTYGYSVTSGILRGMGDSRHPFYFVAFATILNVILDIFFIVILKLEVFGAALATVISEGLSFFCAVIFLYLHREEFGFDFKLCSFRIDRPMLKVFLKLGIPMVLQSASISFSMLFVNAWINSYGVTATAVNGIGRKIASLVNVFNIALAAAGSSMIGQCIGGEKYERVPKILRVSFAINGALALAASIVTVSFPAFIFGVFTDDREVLSLAATFVPVLLVLYFGAALRPPMNSLINGSGNFKLNLAVALLDGVIMRIAFSMVLGITAGFGVYGFWYGNALAGYTPFAIGALYFLSGRWRTNKYIINRKKH